MVSISFSDDAFAAWNGIVARDRPQAEALDALIDRVEAGESGRRRGTSWFLVTRVPGRDDIYVVVWEMRDEVAFFTYIGRSPVE